MVTLVALLLVSVVLIVAGVVWLLRVVYVRTRGPDDD